MTVCRRQREALASSDSVGDVKTHCGEDVHFTGDSAHGDGDIIFGRRVQVLSLDGDDGSSGCWTPRRINAGGFGVLGEQGERVSRWQGNSFIYPATKQRFCSPKKGDQNFVRDTTILRKLQIPAVRQSLKS